MTKGSNGQRPTSAPSGPPATDADDRSEPITGGAAEGLVVLLDELHDPAAALAWCQELAERLGTDDEGRDLLGRLLDDDDPTIRRAVRHLTLWVPATARIDDW